MAESFGTSEAYVFGPNGQQIKIIEETGEVCFVCEDSPNGPKNYGILRETSSVVDLVCPNCGERKTVRPHEVVRKPAETK